VPPTLATDGRVSDHLERFKKLNEAWDGQPVTRF